jgi:hypothetical protein
MQRRTHTPKHHACRHPSHHAISAPQGRSHGLQRNKEGEEERDGRVQVALLQPDVGRKVCGFGVSNLGTPSQHEAAYVVRLRTFDLSRELNKNNRARNGSSRQSSFSSVLLCTLGSTAKVSSASSGGITCCEVGEGTAVSSKEGALVTALTIVSVAKWAAHHTDDCVG